MRNYTEKSSNGRSRIIKVGAAIMVPIAVMLLVNLVFSIIVLKTELPESSIPILSVISSAAACLMMPIMLTAATDLKAILCALYSFAIILFTKFLFTLIIVHSVHFGRYGIIGLVSTAVFCFLGALLGWNLRK